MPDGIFSYLGVTSSLRAAEKPPSRISPRIRKTSMWVARGPSGLGHLSISIVNSSTSGRFTLKSPGAKQINDTTTPEVSHAAGNSRVTRRVLPHDSLFACLPYTSPITSSTGRDTTTPCAGVLRPQLAVMACMTTDFFSAGTTIMTLSCSSCPSSPRSCMAF